MSWTTRFLGVFIFIRCFSRSGVNPFQSAFESPAPDHTDCLIWFWNGDLGSEEIVRQIELMFEKGIRSFVIHA